LPSTEPVSTVKAFRVLVVEDEFLVAMELRAMLEAGGFEVVGPVPTVAAALKQLESDRPDAAVLDVSLYGERVTPVAVALAAMDVPFVLASAYVPADLAGEPVLASARNLGKPTARDALIASMSELRLSSGS
jgi:two-component system, response regulator PdtaR